MAALIDWSTVGQIFVESVAAGVVIVGAVAVGARLLAPVEGHAQRRAGTAIAAAAVCFLVAAVAIGYGVYFTVDK